MSILPQPNNVQPLPRKEWTSMHCFDGSWGGRKGFHTKQMVEGKDDIISVSEEGSVYAMTGDKLTEHMKDKKVLRMESVGQEIFFVLEDMVLRKNGNSTVLFYDGHVDIMRGGAHHWIMRTSNGFMVQGSNSSGQLCIPGVDKSHKPTPAPLLDELPIDEIFVGGWHNYARLHDGSFVGWGYNINGRLGNGPSTTDVYTPIALNHHLLGIKTLACGGWHTIGLTHSGDVYVWGESAVYSLGVEASVINTPTLLMKDMHVINIFSGAFAQTNFVQTRDGKMFVWGSNSENAYFGKLENRETYTNRSETSDRYNVVKKPTLFQPLCNLPIRDFFVGNSSCFITLETRKKLTELKINTIAFVDVKILCL